MRLTGLLLICCVTATVEGAQRDPWNLSNAERAARRLDRAAQKARVEEDRRRWANDQRTSAITPPPRCDDVIDGAVHPELLFPTELFRGLVQSAIHHANIFPQIAAQEAPELFGDPRQWARFTEVVASYFTVVKEQDALLKSMGSATRARRDAIADELKRIHRREVHERAAALRSARSAFGNEPFNRALYEIVAKHTAMCYGESLPDARAQEIDAILEIEKNAQ
jgi:hypothetical protein